MYYAIIGDLISSKSLVERREIQQQLETYLAKLNSDYSTHVVKKLSITLGDEFQGLFSSSEYLLEIIHKLEVQMYPTKLRFGVGIGNMKFDFGNVDTPYQSDGEVWWNARDAIERVKANNSKNKLEDFSNIYIQSKNKVMNHHLNNVLDLCFSIKNNWTDKQKEIISFTIQTYGLNSNFVIKDVANKLNQSNSTVFQKYKAARYLNYVKVMSHIINSIQTEGEVNDF
ncbi:MAG: hypothetical protein KGZ84_07350 [Erysipelotrichia bacterium]|jgi:hypothetical protein|nr:hypothetical protein [Erysipelotrichia bacterium]